MKHLNISGNEDDFEDTLVLEKLAEIGRLTRWYLPRAPLLPELRRPIISSVRWLKNETASKPDTNS